MGLGVTFTCKLAQFPLGVRDNNCAFDEISTKTIALDPRRQRGHKVVVVLGATGTGKSRLSVDLAKHFPAEVVNADKMQLYEGLDIVTNKATMAERSGVPHHLLGLLGPDFEFTAGDFRALASTSIDGIIGRGRLPIIAGGSNSYIESLLSNGPSRLQLRYDCCFLWIDVDPPVLHSFLSDRVDGMVQAGLVQEVSKLFDPNANYSVGVRKAIGVPELDPYLRARANGVNPKRLAWLLEEAIEEIKNNTHNLSFCQMAKIDRLRALYGWDLNRIDGTEALSTRRCHVSQDMWKRHVLDPSVNLVRRFVLRNLVMNGGSAGPSSSSGFLAAPADVGAA